MRFIPAPTRLEFLTAIALTQQFKGLDVCPNYACDDEGLPTCTASGGMADIVCYDNDYNSLVEVTLMCGRSDQINNEMIPIQRHLKEAKMQRNETFSIFVAPVIHEDVKTFIEFAKFTALKSGENLDILAYDIPNFIDNIVDADKISSLLVS